MQITTTNKNYTFGVLTEDFYTLCKHFSFLEHGVIGKSVLGKPLLFFRFGTGSKKVILCGAHHGKEWITSMLLTAAVEKLCRMHQGGERFLETDISAFFQSHSLYIIPMLNPDGVNLCIQGLTDDIPVFLRSRLIGMNGGSRDFIGKWQSNIHGIDLNHNYNALFEKGKALGFADGVYGPGAGRFSGEHPESEPESRALADFTRAICPDSVIAYHAQGQEIFYGFNGFCPAGGEQMAKAYAEKSGYRLITASGLTDCSGYKDWVIDSFRIPAITVEVGLGENPLPLSQFPKIFSDNFSAILTL
ncbi:MAG: M14 family metallocarboxypeptidase [Clostridia bacterium]|nr:M14 family metallocarboxypeptidase [Clostridia bacterium]